MKLEKRQYEIRIFAHKKEGIKDLLNSYFLRFKSLFNGP